MFELASWLQAVSPIGNLSENRIPSLLMPTRSTSRKIAEAASSLDLHRFLRLQHGTLRCGAPHALVAQFSIGDPGQFCTGDYTLMAVFNLLALGGRTLLHDRRLVSIVRPGGNFHGAAVTLGFSEIPLRRPVQ